MPNYRPKSQKAAELAMCYYNDSDPQDIFTILHLWAMFWLHWIGSGLSDLSVKLLRAIAISMFDFFGRIFWIFWKSRRRAEQRVVEKKKTLKRIM
jgi:hypothetical protein